MNKFGKSMITIFDESDRYATTLMHMEGEDNGAVFIDELGKTVNVLFPVVTKTAIKKYGTASAYFASPKGALYIEDDDFNFGMNNFTVDAWQYPTSFTSQFVIFDMLKVGGAYLRNNAFVLVCLPGGKLSLYTKNSSLTPTTNPLTVDQWNHVAVVRVNNTINIYINGHLESTDVFTTDIQEGAFMIGLASDNYTQPFFGYIDEVRVSKNIARWTTDFVPSGPYVR